MADTIAFGATARTALHHPSEAALLALRVEDACMELAERLRAYQALCQLLDHQGRTDDGFGTPVMDLVSARDLSELVRLLNASMQQGLVTVPQTIGRLQAAIAQEGGAA